jgi:hypothetical protein
MTELLTLIVGLLLGYYGRTVLDYVKTIAERLKDKREYERAGVVRPGVTKVQSGTNEPIDLSSDTGGIRRPSPEQAMIANMKEREKRLRNYAP